MLVTLLIPVSALILGGVFLGERLPTSAWFDLLFIAFGLILDDGQLLRRWCRAKR